MLGDLFARMTLARANSWHLLGRLRHEGTGWCLRDPSQGKPGGPEVPCAWDGDWVVHARHRAGDTFAAPDHVQLMAVWEHLSRSAPLDHWVPQAPQALDAN